MDSDWSVYVLDATSPCMMALSAALEENVNQLIRPENGRKSRSFSWGNQLIVDRLIQCTYLVSTHRT